MKNKTILGIAAGSHDASITILEDNKIVFASQSERYSKIKNDPNLNDELIKDSLNYITKPINIVCFYEKPLLKKTRQIISCQFSELTSAYYKDSIKKVKKFVKNDFSIKCINHHKTHASHAFISPYKESIVLVIDSIGEWDTISIWLFKNNELKLLEAEKYPYSLGLFYSAFTQDVGLIPNEHEYILMGMSSFGKNDYSELIKKFFNYNNKNNRFEYNFHKGLQTDFFKQYNKEDIAYSVQLILEHILERICFKVIKYQEKYNTDNLVYSGGIALNCVANSNIFLKYFKNIFIYPNPGDSGTSLGAVLFENKDKINFDSIYLGHNIKKTINIKEIVDYLINKKIVGIANGRAEFGPRALGNRSLLADPREFDIKDKVNAIKKREEFRPFAPVILEEYFSKYFFTKKQNSSPYMQFTFVCKHPNNFPAIVHIDNTSRVQTINEKQNSVFYFMLKEFYNRTGCPMLLNTSLNIKSQPIINDINDVKEFEKLYNVKVF
jgi:carbamoyltransferase